MRIRHGFLVLLLAVFSGSTGQAQTPAPPLEDADRAFAEALLHHDRAAFMALMLPDAECTFPALKKGPEAIVNEWLPFLIDPGTTMLLTTTGVLAAGDMGNTTGDFAIRGRTKNGVQTFPAGTYSIVWKLADGRWKVSTLGGSVSKAAATNQGAAGRDQGVANENGGVGVGPFHFGMTRSEVRQVSACQPYTAVAVTGGLECPHYVFGGREMNISFLFTGEQLRRIQLWYYEGESAAEAREAVTGVLDYLERTAGPATMGPGELATPERVMQLLIPPQSGKMTQVEIVTPAAPQRDVWFARVGRHEGGYLVMLFADPPRGR